MSTFSIVALLVWIAVLELRLWGMRGELRTTRKLARFAVEPCWKGAGPHRWGIPYARQVARCVECGRAVVEVE